MKINKFFFGVAAGIIIIKILPKTKSYLEPKTKQLLSKIIDIKDDTADLFNSINEEALENRNAKYDKIKKQ